MKDNRELAGAGTVPVRWRTEQCVFSRRIVAPANRGDGEAGIIFRPKDVRRAPPKRGDGAENAPYKSPQSARIGAGWIARLVRSGHIEDCGFSENEGRARPQLSEKESKMTAVYMIVAFILILAALNFLEKGSID